MSESVSRPDKDGIDAFKIEVGTPELVIHEWGNDQAFLYSEDYVSLEARR